MTAIFCCTSINAYRPTRTEHELKFWTFTNWATYPQASAVDDTFGHKHGYIASSLGPYAIQLVKQTKFGPLESKRYFVLNTIDVSEDQSAGQGRRQRYAEVKERYLIDGNYKKVNSYVSLTKAYLETLVICALAREIKPLKMACMGSLNILLMFSQSAQQVL